MAVRNGTRGMTSGRLLARGAPRQARAGVSLAVRDGLRSRMRALGVRYEDVSAGLNVPMTTLFALMAGRVKTYSGLGYTAWPEHISAFLDRYSEALTILRRHLEAAQTEIDSAALPRPAVLATMLPTPRRRRSPRTAAISGTPSAATPPFDDVSTTPQSTQEVRHELALSMA